MEQVDRPGRRILVVEDEALIALAEKAELEARGYAVSLAGTGAAAVEACLGPGGRGEAGPELVLMDIDLGPGMDGTEAAARILAERDIPLIFLSSHSEPEVVARTEGITSYGYIVKRSGPVVIDAAIKMAFKLRAARAAAEEEREKYRHLFEQMMDGFALHEIILDGAGKPADYRFVEANPAFFRLTGLDPAATIGRTCKEALPGLEPEWIELYGKVALGGGPVRFELAAESLGRRFAVAAYSPKPGFFANTFEDITERVAAERQLAERNALLEGIAAMSPDVVYLYDLAAQRYVYTNRDLATLLGYDPGADGRGLGPVHPEDLGAARDHAARVAAAPDDGVRSVEFRAMDREGAWRWLYVRERVFGRGPDGAPRTVFGLVQDVTERREIEEELVHSEERLRLAQEAARSGAWEWDLRTGECAWTDELWGLYGLARGSCAPSFANWLLCAAPGDRAALAAAAEAAAAEGGELNVEWRVREPDGALRWVLSRGKPFRGDDGLLRRYAGISIDVTARREAEEARRASEQRYAATLAALKDGVWEVDLRTGAGFASEGYYRLLGYEPGAFPPTLAACLALVHPEDAARVESLTGKSVETGLSFAGDFRMRRADGGWLWTEVRGRPIPPAAPGGGPRMVGTLSDVTGRKETELRVRELLAEKELMLKEVHHRIKNNMNTVLSLLMLQAGSARAEGAREALRDAADRVRGMMILYDKLYREAGAGSLRARDYIPLLVDEVLGGFEPPRGLRAEKDVGEFRLDAKKLQALGILVNEVVTNSMKHAFPGGASPRGTPIVFVRARLEGGKVVAEVGDNGVGLPAGLGPTEAVGAGREAGGGRGFGLVLVEELARQLDAELEIDGSAGVRFALRFAP